MNMNFDFSNSSWTEYSKNLKKRNSSWIDSNQFESIRIKRNSGGALADSKVCRMDQKKYNPWFGVIFGQNAIQQVTRREIWRIATAAYHFQKRRILRRVEMCNVLLSEICVYFSLFLQTI